jgi:hypothetical protein
MKKTMKTIYLPALERRVSLGAYLKAVKTAIANPDEEFKTGLSSWWPTTGREIRAQFFEGVQDRINQAVPAMERGAA